MEEPNLRSVLVSDWMFMCTVNSLGIRWTWWMLEQYDWEVHTMVQYITPNLNTVKLTLRETRETRQ